MRRTGLLLLLCCLALAAAVGWIYQQQRAAQLRSAPKRPANLPAGLQAVAGEGWIWTQTAGGRTVAEVRAKEMQQRDSPPGVALKDVVVKVFHKDDTAYDLIESGEAELRTEDGNFHADGEVRMTMGYKADPAARNRLVHITTSGVNYNMQTGHVTTERRAEFAFENSRGTSEGATYEPETRELRMHDAVRIEWNTGPRAMIVESGALRYREAESKIYLSPWSRLTRQTMRMDAASSVVSLEKGEITLVEAEKAKGIDKQPGRNLEYAADRLIMRFGEKNVIRRIEGERNARVETVSDSGKTLVTANRLDLDFAEREKESILSRAVANGGARVESTPPRTAVRVLRSETVLLAMRPNGEEIESVETGGPGEVEFHPRAPGERYRKLNGERMWFRYAARNQLETFRATKAETLTKGRGKNPDSRTKSGDLLATFDPKSGDLSRLEQWNAFEYFEGERRATAGHAQLEQAVERITLTDSARIWDPAGSTEAKRIELDQKTGNMNAAGDVISTRQPEKKSAASGGSLVDNSQTLQARAGKMTTRNENSWVRYEEKAVVWQGADKVEGDVITIDRKARTLTARGNVFTQTREKAAKDKGGQIFTLVRAPELDYTESEKLAHYRGGVTLERGPLRVTSKALRAWFTSDDPKTPANEANSLRTTRAEGEVAILQQAPDRIRKGRGETAVYEVGEGKVTLAGGSPRFEDSVQGTTEGDRITWFAESDRLIVDGGERHATESRLKRKKSETK